jgi:HEAT repeat protein
VLDTELGKVLLRRAGRFLAGSWLRLKSLDVAYLADPNPRLRWWCVQTLDHLVDPRAVVAIAALLDDPVARVRRNAAHALGCIACKPTWDGVLSRATTAKLAQLASSDTSAKVRAEAAYALSCRS